MTGYNMKINKYDITLNRLTKDKIEVLRQWRNDPKIAKYMDYKEYITPEMQEAWFIRINNQYNYYFIVSYKSKDIGLVNLKNIDYDKKNAEAGIFIYDDKYLNTDMAFRITLCNFDFAFENLNLDYLYGHVMANNKRAIRYNKMLGYKLAENQEGILKQLYFLTKEDYLNNKSKIQAFLVK